ncbi:MAG: hypothetical protein Q9187_007399, partial [Circinaria calcarea]
MAEVVGVVASGISIATLAAQIANSVTKLKSYWDELKEAPEDIRLLIEEIEDLNLLLYDVEDDQRRNAMSSKLLDNTSASRCLEHCKRGADSLKELTDDLATDLNGPDKLRRKWASAKVVLKKDKIEKYKARLERAIRLLSLSHHSYTRALLQLQPDIIVSRISHTMNTIQNHNNVMNSLSTTATNKLSVTASQSQIEVFGSQDVQVRPSGSQYNKQLSKRRVKKREELVARHRVPVWAMKWAWDIEFFRSRSGWTVRLNPINMIPRDSSVLEAIESGDLRALQKLFETGQASISDRTADGVTLLQEDGLDNILNGSSAPMTDLILNSLLRPQDARAVMDMVSLMVNVYDAEFHISLLGKFRGPKEVFLLLQQHTEVPYYEIALEIRADVAVRLTTWVPTNSPELFKIAFAMHPGPIPLAAVQYKSSDGETLLHGWRALLRELVLHGADLHAVLTWKRREGEWPSRTPFLDLLKGATLYCEGVCSSQTLDQPLKVWLEDLESCGVNLLEYGRKEKALYNEVVMQQDFYLDIFPRGAL